MKKISRCLIAFTAAFSLVCGNISDRNSEYMSVYAEDVSSYTIEDINPTASDNLSIGLIRKSYMAATSDGYMRLFYDKDKSRIVVESYSDQLDIMTRKYIAMELSVWGGFYEGSDAYYLIEGENNLDENDDAEVIRVIKYDKNWNRLGAASITSNADLFGGEVRYPFDYGCVEAGEHNGMLYIVTGHQGYVDPYYNMGHQGFLMAAVDEKTMTGSIIKTDLWHSFAQYIEHDDDRAYIMEQSEGSRYAKLSEYDREKNSSVSIPVLEYGGDKTSAWSMPCYATVDGMALSEDNILSLGTSIDQAEFDNYSTSTPYNIYLSVTPKSDFSQGSTEIKWLTDFDDVGQRFYGVTLTKVSDDRFMIMWRQRYGDAEAAAQTDDLLSENTVHYLFVDGSGNKISSEFTANAAFSDCKPVLTGSELVYYASSGYMVNFYSIDAYTGEFSKKCYKVAGDNAQWSYENKTLTIYGSGDMFSNGSSWGEIASEAEKIVIEKGITSVPDEAFSGFSSLKEVFIKSGVKSIGDLAFYGCLDLKKIHIPSSVESIGTDFLWTGYFWTSDDSKVVYADIYAPVGSYAQQYAKENDIDFVAEEAVLEAPSNIKVFGSIVTWEAAENAVKYRVTVTADGGVSDVSGYLYVTEYQIPDVPVSRYTVKVTAYDSGGNEESSTVTIKSVSQCIEYLNEYISDNDSTFILDEDAFAAVQRVLDYDYGNIK